MSVRRGAPYHDRLDLDRNLLIYEGHDVHRSAGVDPKKLDQPMTTPRGGLTENGKFFQAAKDAAAGRHLQEAPGEGEGVRAEVQPGCSRNNRPYPLA
jgi:hypothetical protein